MKFVVSDHIAFGNVREEAIPEAVRRFREFSG